MSQPPSQGDGRNDNKNLVKDILMVSVGFLNMQVKWDSQYCYIDRLNEWKLGGKASSEV